MLHVDLKYASLISSRLEKYKVKKHNPFNAYFRCFKCGDSKKNRNKTRGNFFQKNNGIFFSCFNCDTPTLHISQVLKELDAKLYRDYLYEIYDKDAVKVKETEEPTRPLISKKLSELTCIADLSPTHRAKKYLLSRKIPEKHLKLFYYCSDFAKYTNSIIPDKLDESRIEERIVIPFISKEKIFFGYQGRALDNNLVRYVSIIFNEGFPKAFGMDRIDLSSKVYLLEGPFDSVFIDNAIAMAGSDLDLSFLDKEKLVVVLDNECRNKYIVKRLDSLVERGYNIFVPPANYKHKDINEAVLAGMKKEEIQKIIDNNTYSGLEAKLKLMEWRKS